jgi:hypothetical protein
MAALVPEIMDTNFTVVHHIFLPDWPSIGIQVGLTCNSYCRWFFLSWYCDASMHVFSVILSLLSLLLQQLEARNAVLAVADERFRKKGLHAYYVMTTISSSGSPVQKSMEIQEPPEPVRSVHIELPSSIVPGHILLTGKCNSLQIRTLVGVIQLTEGMYYGSVLPLGATNELLYKSCYELCIIHVYWINL